jgi:hypothetical protein
VAEQLQYISVMTDAASGDLTLELETYNLPTNLLLTLPVTGIVTNSSPKSTAAKIESQVNTLLAASGASFTHIYFDVDCASGEFNLTRTDHVVCFMSQSDFEVRVSANTCKVKVDISSEPLLASVEDVRDQLSDPCSSDECSSSDDVIIARIRSASSWLTSYLNNKIVRTTYLHNFIGSDDRGTYVKNRPLINYYTPAVRWKYPNPMWNWTNPITRISKCSFNAVDSPLFGYIVYKNAQGIIDLPQPYEDGNDIIIAYLAGHANIPQIIKDAMVKFIYFVDNMGEVDSFSVEGTSQKNLDFSEILKGYLPFLGRFKL